MVNCFLTRQLAEQPHVHKSQMIRWDHVTRAFKRLQRVLDRSTDTNCTLPVVQ